MTPSRRITAAALIAAVGTCGVLCGAEPGPLDDAEFGTLHRLIKPHAGESRWMEIDWYPSIWEARQAAAAQGKPIFIMAGSGGAPVAGC